MLGIWGMETNFGRFTGTIPVVRALATLAFIRHRGDFFRNELLIALQMLEGRHVAGAAMLGSWAGAMGQTQFMPSSYVKYAVDGDGDGRADIWKSMPDALASTANYLRRHGWRPGLPWGFEVTLPKGFDFRNHRHGFASWHRLGVRPIDRRTMAWSGEATLLLPAGRRGPAFLVTENYAVIKAYNSSDAYAIGVAHLGDRIYGGRPVAGDWPKDERLLDQGPARGGATAPRPARLLCRRRRRAVRLADPGGGAPVPASPRPRGRRLRRLGRVKGIARRALTCAPGDAI